MIFIPCKSRMRAAAYHLRRHDHACETWIQINAEADATVLRAVGNAEAAKTHAVEGAEAEVIKLKIASMESGNYALVQVAEALAKAGVKLVPDIVAGGGNGAGGTLVDVLLANMIRNG